jgi:hypothetical protein
MTIVWDIRVSAHTEFIKNFVVDSKVHVLTAVVSPLGVMHNNNKNPDCNQMNNKI